MMLETDVSEEIALDRSKEMPPRSSLVPLFCRQEPSEKGTESEVSDFCLRQWHPNEL